MNKLLDIELSRCYGKGYNSGKQYSSIELLENVKMAYEDD